jgi:hypothetical protein
MAVRFCSEYQCVLGLLRLITEDDLLANGLEEARLPSLFTKEILLSPLGVPGVPYL